MDAVDFIRERNRMCKSFGVSCNNCPADKNASCDSFAWKEELVSIVEKWSKENPRKTRQSIFLEQWPDAVLDAFGVIELCPITVSASYRDINGMCKAPEKMCNDCRREFRLKEVD